MFTLQTPPSFTKKISFLKKMSLQNYFHTFFFLDHLDKLLNPDTDQKIIQTMSKFWRKKKSVSSQKLNILFSCKVSLFSKFYIFFWWNFCEMKGNKNFKVFKVNFCVFCHLHYFVLNLVEGKLVKALFHCRHSAQKLIIVLSQVSDDLHRSCFSLKSGFKKIMLTQELILVLNRVSQKYCLHEFFLYRQKSLTL